MERVALSVLDFVAKMPVLTLGAFHIPPLLLVLKSGWRWGLLLWLAQSVGVFISVVYLWNPPVATLLYGRHVRSGAERTCGRGSENDGLLLPKPARDKMDDADEEERSLASASLPPTTVNAGAFYQEYHGHKIGHLTKVRQALIDRAKRLKRPPPSFIYLLGDSTLDNKHWFFNALRSSKAEEVASHPMPSHVADAVNGYEDVLAPPRMVKDVCYWMNRLAADRSDELEEGRGGAEVHTVMTSIEESTIHDRASNGGLLAQDRFVQRYATARDVVILSLGGNDVALSPKVRTALSMFMLARVWPEWMVERGHVAPGFGYFVDLFHRELFEQVLKPLLFGDERSGGRGCAPKKVIVCMLYYLDERPGGSWADGTLGALGYDSNPRRLQLIIRRLFEEVQKRGYRGLLEKAREEEQQRRAGRALLPDAPPLPLPTVDLFPLFRVLDGKSPCDYCQRVEPSVEGGRKMAEALLAEALK